MILQYVYKPILNFIYDKITFRISENVRRYIMCVCFFMIFAVQFLAQYIFLYQGLNRGIRDYIICLLLGVIIIISVNKKLEIIKWRKVIYIPYVLVGVLLLIATLDHELGPAYQAFPLIMLVGFMCLYYVWGNRGDYTIIFESVSKAYVVFIAIIFIACVCAYPYYDNSISVTAYEYAPFGINPNGVTKIFAPGIACGVYLAIINNGRRRKYCYAFIVGASVSVILLTSCRTGLLIIVALAIVVLGYIIINVIKSLKYPKKEFRCIMRCSVTIAVVVLISCFVGIGLLKHSYTFFNNAENSVYLHEAENREQIVEVKRGIGDAEEIERSKIISERVLEGKRLIIGSYNLSKLNLIMAGRVAIWAIYFDNMTWRGNSELLFYDTEFAHNQYIELSYKAGIPTGVLYLILNVLIGGILVMNFIIKNKKYILFQMMLFVVFFITSMLDTGVLPFERGFIFIYYISIAPMFSKIKCTISSDS